MFPGGDAALSAQSGGVRFPLEALPERAQTVGLSDGCNPSARRVRGSIPSCSMIVSPIIVMLRTFITECILDENRKDFKRLIKLLQRKGCEIVTGKHNKVFFNGRMVAVLPLTASDHRSYQNSIGDLKRAGVITRDDLQDL